MLKRVLCILLLIPCLAYANWWHNLWLNNNQQATELLAKKNNILAANTFNDSNWSGIAFYRAHAYESAANKFKLDHSALGYYNLGNSLAFMHKYQEAVD
ncbi:MAG: hypothetical protein ORN24_05545, partial [Burkholderiales bacterium]|nr:hypothetical protein [Burkholderiales bacterium]